MRILVLDTYYQGALDAFYAARPGLSGAPYDEQHTALMAFSFGTADFYSRGLRALGHEAVEAVVNASALQRTWAREHGVREPRTGPTGRWLQRVAMERVERERPDVLYLQDVLWPDRDFLLEARRYVRLIAGQSSYTLPADVDLSLFDVLFSSFPHYVRLLPRDGVATEHLGIGFDPVVLERVGHVARERGAVFVGGLGRFYPGLVPVFEQACALAPVELWGPTDGLPPGSPLRARHHGEAWGLDMYRVIAGAKIVINRHGEIAGPYANNMRLYEATGVGALLITEEKENLHDLFEPGREVVTYRPGDARHLAERINYYLAHDEEREAIARAGQARTLRDHTYGVRMRQLASALERHLGRPRARTSPLSLPAARARSVYKAVRAKLAASALSGAVRPLLRVYRRIAPLLDTGVSRGHRLAGDDEVRDLADGWKDPAIPARQRALVDSELRAMYLGRTPGVFRVAADAVRLAGLGDGLLVEVGCASGYYLDVLTHLLGRTIRYAGLDYSARLVAQARSLHPDAPFGVADATRLPLADRSVDVLLSGGVILHVADWKRAIAESARVSRRGCVFHRTPVIERGSSVVMTKLAYDVAVFEVAFSRAELEACLAGCGLSIEARLVVERTTIPDVGQVEVVTYVCRREEADG